MSEKKWWWLAVNQGSVSGPAAQPFAKPRCVPTPEQFLGFGDQETAERVKRFLVSAPAEDRQVYLAGQFPALLRLGAAAHVRPDAPQPPRQAPTVWLDEGDDADAAKVFDLLPEDVNKALNDVFTSPPPPEDN
jgi:hypothetical protein